MENYILLYGDRKQVFLLDAITNYQAGQFDLPLVGIGGIIT
jgi:hypothetical protein